MKSLTKLKQKIRERSRNRSLSKEHAERAIRDKAGIGRVVLFAVASVALLQAALVYFVVLTEVDRGLEYMEELTWEIWVDQEEVAKTTQALEGQRHSGLLVAIPSLILFGLFFGLAFWSNRKPFAACAVGLAVFTAVILFTVVTEPTALLTIWGLLFNSLILLGLVGAVFGTRKLRVFIAGSATSSSQPQQI